MTDMRQGSCPLCHYDEILEASPVDANQGHLAPDPRAAGTRGWVITGPGATHHYGPLRIYVCRRCGFVQQFVDDPAAIPISEYFQTRLVKPPESDESGGPFR